jgi:hypothetical protein
LAGIGVVAGAVLPHVGRETAERGAATAALFVLLGLAVPIAAAWHANDERLAVRARRVGYLAAGTVVGGGAAILLGGAGPAHLAAVGVVLACVLLAHGGASLARRARAGPGAATLIGVALPALLAAGIFVADPFVEWRGGDASSPGTAQTVITASPLAAATAAGGLDVKWLQLELMYSGPPPGARGLSVIGQYYPTHAPSPLAWSAVMGGLGLALAYAAGVRRRAQKPAAPGG